MCLLRFRHLLSAKRQPDRAVRRPAHRPIFRIPLCTPLNSVILFQYKITGHIATGRSAEIYEAKHVEHGTEVVVKVAPRQQFDEALAYILLLDELPPPVGVPKMFSYGRSNSGTQTFIVTQLLGASLSDISLMMGGRLSMKAVCMLAIQALSRIEHVHSKGIIHGDINPGNIVMGRERERGIVYLIDFEETQRYRDHNGNHIPQTAGKDQRGNFCYCSINSHTGLQLSRRDDLIALGYSLLRLVKGVLPWEKNVDELLERREVVRLKRGVSRDSLCAGLPVQFNVFFKVVQGLAFAEEPQYDGLSWLFKNCLETNGLVADDEFEWFAHHDFSKD